MAEKRFQSIGHDKIQKRVKGVSFELIYRGLGGSLSGKGLLCWEEQHPGKVKGNIREVICRIWDGNFVRCQLGLNRRDYHACSDEYEEGMSCDAIISDSY